MTPVEAMSMGTPVIAYRGGGYTESIIDGKTGILFDDPSADGLIKAIQRFEKIKKIGEMIVFCRQKNLVKSGFRKS